MNAQRQESTSSEQNKYVYLDNNASTAVDTEVLEAMLPYFQEEYGNPSASTHRFGLRAEKAVNTARKQVAKLINATPAEVFFTSGATESNNTIFRGFHFTPDKSEIVTSAIEHSAVLEPCALLNHTGIQTSLVIPDSNGIISPADVQAKITTNTALISFMGANNEIGTSTDLHKIGEIAKEHDVFFHSDLVQAVGKVPVDVKKQNIDFASISSHKIYGPKGVGALFVSKNAQNKITALMFGGSHEKGMRSGTLNVPGIVGFGKACELLQTKQQAECKKILDLRNLLLTRLEEMIPKCFQVNGCTKQRISGNLSLSFLNIDGEELFACLQPFMAISRGSACAASSDSMSHVLKSLGLTKEQANATIRIGIGRFSTEEEIQFVAGKIIENVHKLKRFRSKNPVDHKKLMLHKMTL